MAGLEMYTRNKQMHWEKEGMGLVALHTIVLLLHLYHGGSPGWIDYSVRESCAFLNPGRGCRVLH
jgi:hypothetical protein